MFSVTNEKFEFERKRLFNFIEDAFSNVRPPIGWEMCTRSEDFEREFGSDFLSEYQRYIYHLDPAVTKYVLPFVMKYFVRSREQGIDESVNLDLLLIQLDPAAQRGTGLEGFYEEMFRQYSSVQKKAVCNWLGFLKEYTNQSVNSNLEGAILYWCSRIN